MSESELIGRLYLRVMQGRNLVATDMRTGLSSPFVRVTYNNKQVLRTSVCSKTLDPKWGEDVTINIDAPVEPLIFEVLDGSSGNLAFMGTVTLELSDLAEQVPIQAWYQLKKTQAQQQVSGEIELHLHLKYNAKYQSVFMSGFALRRQNYLLALNLLNQAIDAFSDEPFAIELRNMRATANRHLQRYQEALQDAAYILKTQKNNTNAWYNLGLIYFSVEDYDEARQAFERGAALGDAKCSQALNDLARNIVAQDIRKCITEARTLVRNKQFEEAANIITRVAVELNPRNHIYYWYRSLAYIGAGQPDKAEKDIMTVVRIDPQWPKTNPIRQGEMRKQGDMNPLFQRRWFFLKSFYLFYYKSCEDKDPKGVIILYKAPCEVKKKELYIQGPKRIYRMDADNPNLAQEWAKDLKKVCTSELDLPVDKDEDRVVLQGDVTEPTPTRRLSQRIIEGVSRVLSQASQVAASNILREGWLMKQGETYKRWKKRYFVLKWQTLYYFKNKPEVNEEGMYTGVYGVINLLNAQVQPYGGPESAFFIVPKENNRTYYLRASSEEERSQWIKSIADAIKQGNDTLQEQRTDIALAKAEVKPAVSQHNAESSEVKKLVQLDSVDSKPAASARASVQNITFGEDGEMDLNEMKQRRRSVSFRQSRSLAEDMAARSRSLSQIPLSASEQRFFKFAADETSGDEAFGLSSDPGYNPYNPPESIADVYAVYRHGSLKDFAAERERLLDHGEVFEDEAESKKCCCTIL